jgi:hypothetical protein
MNTLSVELDETFETFLRLGIDKKGRVVGYVVGLRPAINSPICYAWVQKSIETKDGWKNYGVAQRSKMFKTVAEANRWAYQTAKERINAAHKLEERRRSCHI